MDILISTCAISKLTFLQEGQILNLSEEVVSKDMIFVEFFLGFGSRSFCLHASCDPIWF